MTLYGRRVEVELRGGTDDILATLTTPQMTFEIKRQANDTPAEGGIVIWNLTEATGKLIESRVKAVALRAGYGSMLGVIFEGPVRRVEHQRNKLDRHTNILVGGQTLAKDGEAGPMTARSYTGRVAILQVVRDVVEDMGLTLGDTSLVPTEEVVDWAWAGSARRALTSALAGHPVEWFEDNGVVQFSARGQEGGAAAGEITISIETGMVGSPTITAEGARVRTLLNPALKLGGSVRLIGAEVNARYKVVEMVQKGDNRQREFVTELDLAPLETG